MIPLLRYQTALLLRSQRWLPPFLLYAAFLAIGVQSGQPVLDSLGFTAAAVLPAAAWLVRVCATNEPPAARSCVAAAAGAGRAHLACLTVALGASAVIGMSATMVVTLISSHTSTDGRTRVPVYPSACAGLIAVLVCALLGTAVGALTTWPVLRTPGRSVPALLLAVLLVLVVGGSPANAAVNALVSGSQTAKVPLPLLPLALAALLTATASAVACALTTRRSP
ncbi:ABC transporter [Streptomyces sp. NPDC047022]|uniref:ABC transporter n=1 Tax=Streptomyces sp. NPDC047022 TaxID=3155737 RepID=UPI0034000B27